MRAIKLRPFLPVTDFTAIDASNGGIAVFFDMTSFEASTTGGGRGRRERCVKINSSDSRNDVGEFGGGNIGDRKIIVCFFIILVKPVTPFPTVISPASMADLVVVAGNFNRSAARSQRFVDCSIVRGEAIIERGDIFNWFFGFLSEGGRHSRGGDWRGGPLLDKGGSYGSGWCSTLP